VRVGASYEQTVATYRIWNNPITRRLAKALQDCIRAWPMASPKAVKVVPNFCETLIGLSEAVIFLDGQRSR